MQIKTDTGIIDSAVFLPKFDAIISRGLSSGMGNRDGQMCIEAAICAALDLPHGDDPQCVAPAVRSYKIALNDASGWLSPQSRAVGLRNLGIAQLGSKGVVDDSKFTQLLAEKTIRRLIPTLFRQIFKDNPACLEAANRCELEGTVAAARYAATAADAAVDAAHAAEYAAAAAVAADAAVDAAHAAEYAAAAAHAAEYAAAAAVAAAKYAAAAAAAKYAAAAATAVARSEKYLILSAELALEVLTELWSPGVAWL